MWSTDWDHCSHCMMGISGICWVRISPEQFLAYNVSWQNRHTQTWCFLDVWFGVKPHWRLTEWRSLESRCSLQTIEGVTGVVVSSRGWEGFLDGAEPLELYELKSVMPNPSIVWSCLKFGVKNLAETQGKIPLVFN